MTKAQLLARAERLQNSLKRETVRRKNLERALKESVEQQTATSEILRVISSSPTDLQPVMDAVAESAARLCEADAVIFRRDGDLFERVANFGSTPTGPLGERLRLTRGHVGGRAMMDGTTLQVPDIQAAQDEFPDAFAVRARAPLRTVLAVPLMREGMATGVIVARRLEVRPFSPKQVELLKTFADQAVIAIENVRLFKELEARNRDLTEALEQQTATSEILQVISSSPTDVQPTFEAIAASARRLCEAAHGMVFRFDGELIHLAAHDNLGPDRLDAIRSVFPIPPGRGSVTARAILTRALVHVRDRREDPELEYSVLSANFPNTLSVPLLRDGVPLGAITVTRAEIGLFSARQIALLQTFADQAVIAIENVRLFKELEVRNRDLTEALEQQTATAEILRVISSSPTDVQPVFESLVASAARLCGANDLLLLVREGDVLRPVAGIGSFWGSLAADFRVPLVRGSVAARSVIDGTTLHFPDLAALSEAEFPAGRDLQLRFAHRTVLAVPLVREGSALGTIFALRFEVRAFADQQIALLKTFADQAVIAIENVRLFTELQEKNLALTEAHAHVTEALEQQTATAEILRVISRSQTDVQPVFDTIVRSAVRLCDGLFSALYQFDGEVLHQVAQHNFTAEALEEVSRISPVRPTRALGGGRAILERAVVHIPDVETDPEYPDKAVSRAIGFRSGLFVPMLREGSPIGVIMVARAEPGPFFDSEIELLKTFADQAVIAIENVRLFTELEARTGELTQSVDKLTALGEVGRAVSSTLDLETVLTTIVLRAVQLSGLDGGVVFEYDEGSEEFVQRVATETGGALAEARRTTRIRKGEGVLGRTAITLEPVQVPDITAPGAYEGRLRETLVESGIRAILAVPMVRENRLIGCLGVTRNRPGEFPPETMELLRTFATQSTLAIQNARLFHEIEDKSRQLEAASRHKSEFLANMSHELRTPLNAIIGFSEVLTERMFGELNEKQDEYLKDIYASGQHLLSLINDILDLSKIEAGRMELEVTDFDLPNAIDNALILVRERTTRRGITLGHSVDERLGSIRGDERKVKQVLLNLLSNALKFTPEGGRIDVRAVPHDGVAEIAVADTGVGIAPEDQEAVFEEFRQVGTADKKVEGTGLGLALSRKFIELHGGRIWVESEPGKGSTFRFTLPSP